MLTDNQIKDDLNSMNTSELKELNHDVRQELEEKSMENPNDTMPGVLIDQGPGPHALNHLLENGSKAEGQATVRMPNDAAE
jgi:hypothetical protein